MRCNVLWVFGDDNVVGFLSAIITRHVLGQSKNRNNELG